MARSIPRSLTTTSRGLHWIASLGISSPGFYLVAALRQARGAPVTRPGDAVTRSGGRSGLVARRRFDSLLGLLVWRLAAFFRDATLAAGRTGLATPRRSP